MSPCPAPPYTLQTQGESTVKDTSYKKGFTLVEALVSVALLGIVIAGSYVLMNRSAQLVRSARNHYLAINLGKNRIERARTMRYSDLTLLAEQNVIVDDNGVPFSAGDFRRTTIVDTNTAAGLTAITVSNEVRNVRTRQFQNESESVSSLFTEYLTVD